MSAQQRRAGFTLIELMVVVLIIGISAVAFAPGISRAMAERKVSFATRETLRIAKRGRAEALTYRRAYLMWVRPGPSNSDAPIVQLLQGTTGSCIAQNWTLMQASCGAPAPANGACVENANFSDTRSSITFKGNAFSVRMLEGGLPINRAFCWAPDGVVYTGTSLTITAGDAINTVLGAVIYRFALFQNGAAVGAPHDLMIPLGAAPSVLQ